MKTLFLVAIVSVFSSFSALSQDNVESNDETTVYLYRLKSMVGGAVAWPIFLYEYDKEKKTFLEKQKIGKIKQKQYMPISIKANTMYYIEVGTMQKILVLGKEKAKIITQLKGGKIKVTAKDNFALVKLGAGNRVSNTSLVELAINTAINKSNKKKFVEKKFLWLEPIENNPDYEEMMKFKNCLKK